MKKYSLRWFAAFAFFTSPLFMGAGNLTGGGCSSGVVSTYNVSFSGSHVSFGASSPQTVSNGEVFTLSVSADTGYVLTNTVGGTCPAGAWSGSNYTTGAIVGDCSLSFSASNPNAPWYLSLSAFEHYDSGRSHLFSQATFGGDFSGGNSVESLLSDSSYPSLYNIAYLDENQIFAYGGGYGNEPGSIGAYVARIDPDTLAPIWYTPLIDTQSNGEWDYPGVMGILEDGFIYVIYGYRLSKLDPSSGEVIATLELPTGAALPENTAYNGFNATPQGFLVMKAIYRQAGCALQGPAALTDCPDPSDIPASVMVSVNPQTMEVMDELTLTSAVYGRLTVGTYNNQNYVYLALGTSLTRYAVSEAGEFSLDASWNPGTLLLSGQTAGSAVVVMDDWIVGQTNASPSTTPLSLFAVNQGNAQTQFSVQPFLGDPIPPFVDAVYAPNVSWMPSAVSVDPENGRVYCMDAIPGEIAAYQLSSGGFQLLWKADQATTESIAIIGPSSERVIVGTHIPSPEIPNLNANDSVVWRNAADGSELASSGLLPQITTGAMVQPSYSGDMFYGGVLGDMYKLMPAPSP